MLEYDEEYEQFLTLPDPAAGLPEEYERLPSSEKGVAPFHP